MSSDVMVDVQFLCQFFAVEKDKVIFESKQDKSALRNLLKSIHDRSMFGSCFDEHRDA
jgi:hypothetical protein